MRRYAFLALFVLFTGISYAGGLLTNTNQSAQFIRMMSRNASLGIDAVYFNPAGLIRMDDGWHFAFYSQSIWQTKSVDSKFPLLTNGSYEGIVNVPVFPTAFAVYKKENLALSLGFGPNAGGGTAEFERGLPSFEIPLSKIVPGLAPLAGLSQAGVNIDVPDGYNANLYFNGSSIFWGIQLGATYKVNNAFSFFGGVRYLPARNTYEGSIKDIRLAFNGQEENAMDWMNEQAGVIDAKSTEYSSLAAQAAAGAAQFSGAASNMQSIVDAGGGTYTLDQLEGGGFINETQKAQLEGGLQAIGLTSEQISDMSASVIEDTYSTAATNLQEQSQAASGAAALLGSTADDLEQTAAQMGNKEVKTEQTGAGFTPMIGMNFSPTENWNIGLKYEMKTVLELENSTEVDDLGLFPDGGTARSDIPGLLGMGVGYNSGRLEAQLSYNLYFNKGVDWGDNTRDQAIWEAVDPDKVRQREISRNGMELGLGFEFGLTDNFAFSVGGLYGDMGVADSYQSDFSYSNPSVSAGAGIQWMLAKGLALDAGVSNTFYKDQTVSFEDPDLGTSYKETLGKTTFNFAVGLSYSIF